MEMLCWRCAEKCSGIDFILASFTFIASSRWLGAVNGGLRAHSSYIRQPRDHKSDFSSYSCSVNCSCVHVCVRVCVCVCVCVCECAHVCDMYFTEQQCCCKLEYQYTHVSAFPLLYNLYYCNSLVTCSKVIQQRSWPRKNYDEGF